ncbi:hypothetical protein EON64_16360 [archaeon]|nr:MAG: hypothetical protein EON64_16360 [archaeon]
MMNDCGLDEFHRLDQTSQTRQDQRVWEKLKTHLQVNHQSVLEAFQGRKMSIPTLVSQLRKHGYHFPLHRHKEWLSIAMILHAALLWQLL